MECNAPSSAWCIINMARVTQWGSFLCVVSKTLQHVFMKAHSHLRHIATVTWHLLQFWQVEQEELIIDTVTSWELSLIWKLCRVVQLWILFFKTQSGSVFPTLKHTQRCQWEYKKVFSFKDTGFHWEQTDCFHQKRVPLLKTKTHVWMPCQ